MWLTWKESYEVTKMLKEARFANIHLDAVPIHELEFIVDERRVGIYRKRVNVADYYDLLCVRTMRAEYVSDILTLSRLFKEGGKEVVDKSLTTEGYAMGKMHDYLLLAQKGIPVPVSYKTYSKSRMMDYTQELGFPNVLKSIHGSQGRNVHMGAGPNEYSRMLESYPDGELIAQKFLPASEDYRVLVIGYKALPVFLIRHPQAGDFRTNFAVKANSKTEDLNLFPELRNLAEKSARILKREFAGVDIRRDKDGKPYVLEVNRRPGFEGFELASKYNVAKAFLEYLIKRCQYLKKD